MPCVEVFIFAICDGEFSFMHFARNDKWKNLELLKLVLGIQPKFQPVRNKKIEKTHVKEKLITCTRQYLRGLAICLRPRSCRDFTIIREKIQSAATVFFSLSKNTTTVVVSKP